MAKARFPLLMLGGLALLVGLWAGLVRLGWRWPAWQPAAHGPLMISGFLGTVISLERAVALSAATKSRWAYGVPLCAGLGGLALLLGWPSLLSRGLFIAASLGLTLVFVSIGRLQLSWPHVVMGLGALLWLIGNGLWWRFYSIPLAVPWWVGFLVLTIAGERLELARVLLLRRWALVTFLLGVGILLAGLLVSAFDFSMGVRISGVGLALVGLWLLRYDLARRTIRQTGLTRFIAACLLPGYIWLVVAGGLWLTGAEAFVAGPLYDAMLHALLLGFVFSMIFGHEPIIVPALLNVSLAYTPRFYLHLGLLHLSLVVRVAGDLAPAPSLRMWGGLLNALAIVLFIGNTVWAVRPKIS